MSEVIEQMLKNYNVGNIYDQKNAMKEIMQEIVLCGLSRAGFFQKAAFYGGTALRIFYGLDRFSEDLDFSLETADPSFDLTFYFPVLEYDMPSLFSRKIHAVLCRAWQSRIKGRDLYDYVFYLSRGTAVNQKHLRERLLQSGFITSDEECTLPELKQMLYDRFDSIDFVQAKQDVEPFIHDTSVLNVWSAEFFKQITEGLRAY